MEAGTPRTAAALAYFLLLTLFPILVCINWFISLFRVDLLTHMEALQQVLPASVLSIVEDYLTYSASTQSPALLTACLFTVLVSGSAGLRNVFLTLEDLAQVEHRSTLWKAIHSVVLSVLLLLTIYLSMVVIFTGDWFFSILYNYLPQPILTLIPLDALSALWDWLRYLLLFAFVLLLILGIYMAGMPKGVWRPRVLLCCSLLTSITLVGASAIFSIFIGFSTRYALIYGSLASIIVLIIWLYFIGNIVLLGAAVGCVWERRHRNRHGGAADQKDGDTKKDGKNR